MAKTESTFLSMSLTLLVISLVASASLGFIYNVTKEPIEKSKAEKVKAAIKVVLPDFKETIVVKIPSDGDSLTCYIAVNGTDTIGYAIETYTDTGFSGHIDLMVGFLKDGKIYNTAVLKHAETPGLGDKMDVKKSDFALQFKDKDATTFKLKVKKDGGDVQAITAATISSRAFCDAVERADKALKNFIHK